MRAMTPWFSLHRGHGDLMPWLLVARPVGLLGACVFSAAVPDCVAGTSLPHSRPSVIAVSLDALGSGWRGGVGAMRSEWLNDREESD